MANDGNNASSLWRWRPALLGTAAVAATFCVYYVFSTKWTLSKDDEGSQGGLRRSNAVRRRPPRLRHAGASITGERSSGHSTQPVNASTEYNGPTARDADDESEFGSVSPAALGEGSGQSLLNLLFHIAEEQAHKEGYVHRGVTCNSCSTLPIKGIRYRCTNCPDYDLCEQCENLGVHDKTHLFYKIRIPAPFLGSNPRNQQPVWYPGRSYSVPRAVPKELRKRLVDLTGFDRSRIDALWEQFRSLAAVDWPEDPNELHIAIDRNVWSKYCMPTMLREHEAPSALIFDRSFAFYDENEDGLVGFEEFLAGLAAKQGKDPHEKLRRIFRAHDLDDDGYICREDLMKLFTSYYTYQRELSRDLFNIMYEEVLDDRTLKQTLQGNQPVSSCFTGGIPPGEPSRIGEGKTMTSTGDFVVTDGGDFIRQSEDDLIHDSDAVEQDCSMLSSGRLGNDLNEFIQAVDGWPPDFVIADDANTALGRDIPLCSITTASEQRRVLIAANMRIEQQKQQKQLMRQRRQQDQFPIGNDALPADVDPQEQKDNASSVTSGQKKDNGSMRSGSNTQSTPEIGDLEESLSIADYAELRGINNFTPDFLYQATREGFEELLDPVFKQLEDLHEIYRRTYCERLRLRRDIQQYRKRRGNDSLVQIFLNRHLRDWRRGGVESSNWYGDKLGEGILSELINETKILSDEWVTNIVDKILLQLIDERELNQELEQLTSEHPNSSKGVIRKLRHIWVSTKGGKAPNPEQLDDYIDRLSERSSRPHGTREANPVAENLVSDVIIDELAIQELLDTGEIPDGAASFEYTEGEVQEALNDLEIEVPGRIIPEPSAESGQVLTTNTNTIQSSEISQDLITPTTADVLDTTTADEIMMPLPTISGRELQNRRDNSDAQQVGVLDESIERLLGDFDFDSMASTGDPMETEPLIDPTLPQNRPDTVHPDPSLSGFLQSSWQEETTRERSKTYMRWSQVKLEGSLESMEQRDPHEDQDSQYFLVKLKFFSILETCADRALSRGGVARLNREEFEEIMTGEKGRKLEAIGKWLDLAAF